MVVDCTHDPQGTDELLCLIQDPFKAAVSPFAPSYVVSADNSSSSQLPPSGHRWQPLLVS